ncbi:hypothetical protein FMEAI12_3950003 [Parafrankia sp. Ea1.12]|nr:hypothetical protein FMEAI12_3950003 [Parafrankia sp. Ea1.12]
MHRADHRGLAAPLRPTRQLKRPRPLTAGRRPRGMPRPLASRYAKHGYYFHGGAANTLIMISF